MIRNMVMVCLTLALILVHAPPKEANGHGGNLIRRPLDQPAQDPVIVKVSVRDEKANSFVGNLRAEDFVIEEDGERQKPTRFLSEERPLSILLLIDASGSMRPTIQPILKALSNGLKHLKPDDEVALMAFNREVHTLQDFTRDKGLVEEKLREVVVSGPTLARQGLVRAATHIRKATSADSRRVIVVITDNARSSAPGDVLSEEVVMQQLSQAGSVVSVITVPNRYPMPGAYFTDITPYIEETGGIFEKEVEAQDLSTRLVKTVDAFRNYYLIEYSSTNLKRDGKHRKIKVTLSPDVKKTGGKLTVLAKRGYYGPDNTGSGDKK